MPTQFCSSQILYVALATWLSVFALTAYSNASQDRSEIGRDDSLFPRPAQVRKQVRFWRKVFYEIPSTKVIIHEAADPEHIIEIIDYAAKGPSTVLSRQAREELTSRRLSAYAKAAENFAKEGAHAPSRGVFEQTLFEAFRSSPSALKRLYKGEVRIRAQSGLADDFLQAAATAQVYLPSMEKVFLRYGVPTLLTRLPFVESMFNLKARSKVGASGIWQFMPQTARNFIYVNQLVDERNAPEKATKAAAQFLANNYHLLGSWPLAVTAYNHGVLGMANAVKKVGSRDIGAIIDSYSSPSFGFASRNFYSEFLAAADIYDRLYRQQRILRSAATLATASVILDRQITLKQFMDISSLSQEVISALNPCLLETAWNTYRHKLLPPFYELKVPKNRYKSISLALKNLTTKKYARR